MRLTMSSRHARTFLVAVHDLERPRLASITPISLPPHLQPWHRLSRLYPPLAHQTLAIQSTISAFQHTTTNHKDRVIPWNVRWGASFIDRVAGTLPSPESTCPFLGSPMPIEKSSATQACETCRECSLKAQILFPIVLFFLNS